jgi:hypothetical protein
MPTIDPYDRRSGRTTRGMLRALIAMSEGEAVIVIAYTSDYAKRLARKLMCEAERLGIPDIDVSSKSVHENVEGLHAYVWRDHYEGEDV